jgi:pseudouridine kinase
MGIVVIGAAFVDIKGFPYDVYIPDGRNAGRVEYVHGGVARNVVEDIANVELRPVYLGLVDDSPLGEDVLQKLRNHKVNCDYVKRVDDGMGTWLAVFDNNGDVAGSISKRPNMMPILEVFEEHGDEIFSQADSIVVQVDLAKEIIKKTIEFAKKYNKKLFALVSNMSIAAERRDFLQDFDCFICNRLEAGILFSDDYSNVPREELKYIIAEKVSRAQIPSMIVTMGGEGAVYATKDGEKGACPARNVQVKDTTGAGDAFCAGASIGLTYGKTFAEAIEIGSHLAASVITSSENVCPRFLPQEFGIDVKVED